MVIVISRDVVIFIVIDKVIVKIRINNILLIRVITKVFMSVRFRVTVLELLHRCNSSYSQKENLS